MTSTDSVMVHVRRGDYVSLAAAAANHGTCTPEYYRAALDLLRQTVPAPTLFVFSDDPAWATANLRFDVPTRYVSHNPPSEPDQDLRLMSACRHAIIANSSFSWWGAWLGQGERRVVIAPSRWFADGRPTPDLIPTDWRTL